MTREAAVEITTMIDRHWNLYLFAAGQTGAQLWIDYLMKQDDVEKTMRAVVLLSERMKEKPTVSDLRGMLANLYTQEQATSPALPEPKYERELPGWVKGWIVAYAKGDKRVWPQQKLGYDQLQREHDTHRTYVWPEQEQMPEAEREAYEQMGARLEPQRIAAMIVEAATL